MRTSKISQDTTRVFGALSPNTQLGRTTRSARRLASFALGYNGKIEVKEEEDETGLSTGSRLESAEPPDIEDGWQPARTSKKRKLSTGSRTPASTVVSAAATTTRDTTWVSPRRVKVEKKDEAQSNASPPPRGRASPKVPARKSTLPSGEVIVLSPSNWSEMYDTIKAMRARNPTAPVDTMGCEDLFWRGAPPREMRYHTLTALMLSSQTKDTVTAAAMHRLHTELAPQPAVAGDHKLQSCLTVDNIMACDPTHLDHLIGKVGFHNNKTKFIKQVAAILKRDYQSDIPDTIEGLVGLPGVGPKMAYLCMSAAWGVDAGIGVDVHVHRITNLWGWHKTKTPEETRMWLEGWLPRDRWHEINKMLVGLGQTVCLPVGRRCGECDLAGTGLCKSEIRGWKPAVKKAKREAGQAKHEDQEDVSTSSISVG